MSHARIDTSVPRHPKFLRAGPAASWLWLAGVCYCQEALTDGVISTEAIYTLGVPKPLPLATKLVETGLWHPRADGWQIHDYLDHNNNAEYIREVKRERQAAGRKGGRPKHSGNPANQRAINVPKQCARQPDNPSVPVPVPVPPSTTVPVHDRGAAGPPHVPATDPDLHDHYAMEAVIPLPSDLVSLWNELVTPPIPQVMRLTADRARKITARLQVYPDLGTWRTVIAWIETQDWMRAPGTGDHPNWTATLDWLCKSDGQVAKCFERASTPGGQAKVDRHADDSWGRPYVGPCPGGHEPPCPSGRVCRAKMANPRTGSRGA